MLEPYIWLRRANAIETLLPTVSTRKAQEGQKLIDGLRAYGAFYQRVTTTAGTDRRFTPDAANTKPDTSYSLRIDSKRTYDLPTLETLLRKLLKKAELWIENAVAVEPSVLPESWTPDELDLAGWWDAVNVIQSSGAISQLTDKSGNGAHWVQAVGVWKPLLLPTAWNGNPAIRFAPPAFMASTASSLIDAVSGSLPSYTLLVTCDTEITSSYQAIIGWRDNPSISENLGTAISAGGFLAVGRGVIVTGSAAARGTRRLAICVGGGRLSTYVDGQLDVDEADFPTGFTLLNQALLGVGVLGGDQINGLVAEAMLAREKLDAATVSKYQQYSRARWG